MHSDPHHMYYAAILCPQAVDEKITGYKQWMRERFGCTAALKSPAHITLVAPFWLADSKENELLQVFDAFKTESPAFPVMLNNFSHFNNRVLFVHVDANEELAVLQSQVTAHLTSYFSRAIKPDQRPFHPHVTIATRDLSPAAFNKAWERFSKEDFNAEFTCTTVCLLKLNPGKWIVIREKRFQST